MSKGASVNLDSFLDIMTCLVGVLVLIIILTGLDAAQIRVLIPTPMMYDSDKRPIFVEARNNQLFLIPVDELQEMADNAVQELSRAAGGNPERMLAGIQTIDAATDAHRLDLSYFMVGQIGIMPVEGAQGYALRDWANETSRDWFGQILAAMDPEQDMLAFMVRDDSFEVFKLARHLAWLSNVDVAYELLSMREPIRFGLLGQRVRPQ